MMVLQGNSFQTTRCKEALFSYMAAEEDVVD
jgi:hypothetical protein